ncbi:MAG: IclR family transcriptional regulator [Acidimicrobiia bacterium]
MDSLSGVGVIDKSAAILEALADRGPTSLPELVEATSISRPTAHRLAVALESHGLVGRDERGRFRLGVRLAAWGRLAPSLSATMLERSADVLAELRDETGESAQLYVRDGDHRVCVAAAERPAGLRDTVPVGARLPLIAGSGGKVLLAWADASDWPSGVDAAALRGVRQRGWAASVAEREPGVASVSAPVFGPDGEMTAALSVSGPIDRLGRRPGLRFAPALVRGAERLRREARPRLG